MAIEQEWWQNKLAEDIYATLKLREQTVPALQGNSTQLWMRRHLVDWLSEIVGELGVCATAQHLAVHLLDHFMDGLEVEMAYLHLAALTCLLLAVKFEDHCDRIPHISRLNSYVHVNQYNGGQPYTARQFLQMELNILKFANFELCIPTVPHFLPYFLKVAVDEDDLVDGAPISSKGLVETYLHKHAAYFQEIVLQDHMYSEYCPSLVAASCVAAARICLHLTPTWPKQLELMTDFFLEQLLPCIKNMLGTHQRDSNSLTSSSLGYLPSFMADAQSYPPCYLVTPRVQPAVQSQQQEGSVVSSVQSEAHTGRAVSKGVGSGQRYQPYLKTAGRGQARRGGTELAHRPTACVRRTAAVHPLLCLQPLVSDMYASASAVATYGAAVDIGAVVNPGTMLAYTSGMAVPQLCPRIRGS
ncbi:cyclin-J-like [Dreissena polymorpha]|nr:cyclin-J-like [Dreissena polymorpha]